MPLFYWSKDMDRTPLEKARLALAQVADSIPFKFFEPGTQQLVLEALEVLKDQEPQT